MADQYIRDHQAWLGYLQPDGLVVSPAALVDAQVILPNDVREQQRQLLELVVEVPAGDNSTIHAITSLPGLFEGFFEWPEELLFGLNQVRPLPQELSVPLLEFGETLQPTAALADAKPKEGGSPWLLLIQSLPVGTDLDAAVVNDARGWSASPARRFERLLRETRVPIGLLINGTQLRLMYAPRGENAGSLTFPVNAMLEVAGRPIVGALHMLLKRSRMFAGAVEERLPALLAKSRAYQSTVSTRLSRQVLDALYELLRGFQAADRHTHGALLRDVLARDPDAVYGGLLNVLLRMVFLLYAEDRGLMPGSSVYVQNYSVHGLFERLREDAERYPDTMDHRYGAWAQLLALFNAVYGGCSHPQLHIPAREGYLFDPDRFPFLEGRSHGDYADRENKLGVLPHHVDDASTFATELLTSGTLDDASAAASHHVPLVADGVIWRILSKLLLLDGERLSYRTLDVEQIGSVYETMMGFRLEVATGPTIALKPAKAHGAPPAINLEALLAVKPEDRAKWLREETDHKLEPSAAEALKHAGAVDEALASLERRVARNATPHPVPKGAMILQPSDERRRSGSHYTPRSLTEPIVQRTLAPILDRLGASPTPAQILELKVCDPAVGSGAFLVATCRELGDALVLAWHAHGQAPNIPPDEDEVLHARRLVAQRCLYGLDRNPMAVDLAKLSLWLSTLARDHPFTFLDHAIRIGDSLVGLTRQGIEDFHWKPAPHRAFGQEIIRKRLAEATASRREILEAGDGMSHALKRQKLAQADRALDLVRLAGDLPIVAFFSAERDKAREQQRNIFLAAFVNRIRDLGPADAQDQAVEAMKRSQRPVHPFHWEIEFPEVFDRDNPGFDAIVGNPPFAGKNTLIAANPDHYVDWLKELHAESHGNSDLVAHFFRRAFNLLRNDGCLGLIATNTIGQGDTRATGLRWICKSGGAIYWARKRFKWPGEAAVIVSIVHIVKGIAPPECELDGRSVEEITAYLFHQGTSENPAPLSANRGKAFVGCYVLGMGFTFDDSDVKGVANTLDEMRRLISVDERNAERILPFIGGEELNDDPRQRHHRFVIYLDDLPLCREETGRKWSDLDAGDRILTIQKGIVPADYPGEVAADWPDLLSVARTKVKPARQKQSSIVNPEKWWRYGRSAADLFAAISGLDRVIAVCLVTKHLSFAFLPSRMIYSKNLAIFPFDSYSAFAMLQSQAYEAWTRFFSSTLEDRLNYSPSDCFETFPFPMDFERSAAFEGVGHAYYDLRVNLMRQNGEGLTRTYNRFHDPDEIMPDILRLRELHTVMDRAILDAYGWTDLSSQCEFLLDYAEDDEGEGTSRRKKPWRWRWPDETRDEVLARILALNVERAADEAHAGIAVTDAQGPSAAKPRSVSMQAIPRTSALFDDSA